MKKYILDVTIQVLIFIGVRNFFTTTCSGRGLYMIENCVSRDWGIIIMIMAVSIIINVILRIILFKLKK